MATFLLTSPVHPFVFLLFLSSAMQTIYPFKIMTTKRDEDKPNMNDFSWHFRKAISMTKTTDKLECFHWSFLNSIRNPITLSSAFARSLVFPFLPKIFGFINERKRNKSHREKILFLVAIVYFVIYFSFKNIYCTLQR